ncbi:NADH dehydrogenase [ubiquinone] flavoprotein 3, mitochondrial-like [Saccostrea cucullata]|uniref:NADH dehydrogenase [ubiquinone] flavoprotein 3, mitochondrial-like n=1 Tax=Saccostrea cuccullata TaxID=36930 RepID=UPI002ED3E196
MISLHRQILFKINKPVSTSLIQRLSGQSGSTDGQSTPAPPPPSPPPSAESKADSDNTTYKVKEYYGYNAYSFYDIDKDMSKFRNPQPSKYTSTEPAKQ